MIRIRINKKQTDIPTYRELSVNQYEKVINHIIKTGGIDIVSYLSIVLDRPFREVAETKIKNIDTIYSALGTLLYLRGDGDKVGDIAYIEDVPPNNGKLHFYLNGKRHLIGEIDPLIVGKRLMFEQLMAEKISYIEAYVLSAAIAMDDTYNIESIRRSAKRLREKEYIGVLSMGAFFFRSFKGGKKQERRHFRRLRLGILTSIWRLRNRLAWTS